MDCPNLSSIILPAAAFLLVAGCAQPSSSRASVTTSPEPVVSQQPPMSMEEIFSKLSGPREQSTVESESTDDGRDRHGRLIGMYGEQVGDADDASDASQPGTANIAQVSFAVEGACFDPAVDREGRRLVFASTMHRNASDIYVKSIAGTTVTQLTDDPADDIMPAFHPDGKRIAFASNRAGKWDIYMTSINGGPPVQITSDNDAELHPTFSPDGKTIAYCKFSDRSGRWEIWAVQVDNPGIRTFLEYGMFPKWSPDVANNKILFQRPRERGSRLHGIWTIDYVNGEALHPTEIVSAANAAVINPSWSPDGRRITFVSVLDPENSPSERPEQSDVWVINVDGSGRTKLTDSQFANFQPIWATDGRVYFVSNRSGVDNIWAISTDRTIDIMQESPTGVAGVDPNRER